MANKGDAHEALSLFLKHNGVTPNTIVDGPKDQTLGGFKCKVSETGCHLSQTKP